MATHRIVTHWPYHVYLFLLAVTMDTSIIQGNGSVISKYFSEKETHEANLNCTSPHWKASSRVECASVCSSDPDCHRFLWNSQKSECTFGSRQPSDSEKFFILEGSHCPQDSDFQLHCVDSQFRCIHVSTKKGNFFQATDHCLDLGARLVKADSVGLLNLIMDMSIEKDRGPKIPIHIGLDDLESEGDFVWSDGQKMTSTQATTLFALNQPDNHNGKEHCCVIKERALDDMVCQLYTYFACEKVL